MNITLVKSDPRAREKPCLRCGYSLRKIVDSTHCPECGLSIWLSLNANDALDWSNPDWLRRMSRGAWIMAAAQLIGLAAVILLWLEHPRMMPIPGTNNPGLTPIMVPGPLPTPWWGTGVVSGIYLLMYNAALLLLAVDEGRYPDKWRGFRWACRITAIAGILIGGYLLTSSNEFLFKLSLLASAIATFAYLRKLAQRIPHSLLVRLCGIILFVPILSLLKSTPILWYFALLQFTGILEYLPWVYLPVALVLLGWFALLFQRSARSAKEGWLKETADSTKGPAAV